MIVIQTPELQCSELQRLTTARAAATPQRRRRRSTPPCALALAWLVCALPAAARTDDAAAAPAAESAAAQATEPAAAPAAPASSAGSEGTFDRLTFHAYVNQAYAISQHHQIEGIPTSGTADDRTVALQFRFALAASDAIVAQLGSFRYGVSPINKLHSDVELEFAFYQHKFADTTSVKVGKLPLPIGIYNEIRDVGTLLPFYGPPLNMYLETYASRNLEGLMISRSFGKSSDWSVDADLFGGGWRRLEENQTTGQLATGRIESAAGTEVWLNTPLSGVRVGAGYIHFLEKNGLSQVDQRDPQWITHGSIDATFERFYVRTEMLMYRQPYLLAPGFALPALTFRIYYGQAGYNLTRQLSVNLQADFADFNTGLPSVYAHFDSDYAASLVYKLRSNLAVKIEGHRNRGMLVELEPSGPHTITNYGIVSLSATY